MNVDLWYKIRRQLLESGKLTTKERFLLQRVNATVIPALCAELAMKMKNRLSWKDMPIDNKGNAVFPENYDQYEHIWK